jgi:hypothetical protein
VIGHAEELTAPGGVRQHPLRVVEGRLRRDVAGQQPLALALGGGELVLGPLHVRVDLEAVVADHVPAEHRRRLENGREIPGHVRAWAVVGVRLGAHPTCLPARFVCRPGKLQPSAAGTSAFRDGRHSVEGGGHLM